jgi:sterol 14-demethylase
MVRPFGLNVTLLIGPEVTGHFFQGLESEISHGNLFEFTVPMFGNTVFYGRDSATRVEQTRFHIEALKPSSLSRHVSPMIQEVEVRTYSDKHAYNIEEYIEKNVRKLAP